MVASISRSQKNGRTGPGRPEAAWQEKKERPASTRNHRQAATPGRRNPRPKSCRRLTRRIGLSRRRLVPAVERGLERRLRICRQRRPSLLQRRCAALGGLVEVAVVLVHRLRGRLVNLLQICNVVSPLPRRFTSAIIRYEGAAVTSGDSIWIHFFKRRPWNSTARSTRYSVRSPWFRSPPLMTHFQVSAVVFVFRFSWRNSISRARMSGSRQSRRAFAANERSAGLRTPARRQASVGDFP